MNKKQIIILIVIGVVVLGGTFFTTYYLRNKPSSAPTESKSKNQLTLKDYTLDYGTYVGEEAEYNPDTKKTDTKKVKIKLTKDKINDQEYIIKDNSIYIKSNGSEILMYEVSANNTFTLLAGSGIDFKLEK